MRSHSLKCGLVIGFLAVGLLAAAAAAAAEGPEKPKIDFIYPKGFEGISLAIQDAPTPAAKASKLSVKLYGGYSHVLAGDVNDGSDYYFEILEYYQAEGTGTVTGSYKPVHGGYSFGGDIIYQLSPKLGLGLGVGYMRNSSSSVGTFTDGETESVTLTVVPTLTAMPIRLGLFFTTPLANKLNLTADAGAAYYAGLKLESTQGLEFSPTEWMEMTVQGSQRSGIDIGFHGSLGVEYMLSPKLGFFFEAVGRYAKFKNFELVTGTTDGSGGGPDTTEGKLYIFSDTAGTTEISGFTIVATGDPVDPSYLEPKIDLSGFSLQIGIRIRL
ncbi:MAG: outer membrane beta-barrel protein [Candidatus Aminicenantes bacterium]|nr:outer membrane beta-barrel protein [Candidatus Aminicenantes bacterium]